MPRGVWTDQDPGGSWTKSSQPRSDTRIREDIHERLADHDFIDASSVQIDVAGGEVTLRGTVPRADDQRMIEDVIEKVLGVKRVRNDLQVRLRAEA